MAKTINEDGSISYGPPYAVDHPGRFDRNPTRKNPKTGEEMDIPICGAQKRNGGICHMIPGQGTDHVGYGHCKFHQGNLQTAKSLANKQNLADGITYPGIREEMERLGKNRDVFDMREHIFLLEAIAKTILNHAKTAEDLFPVMKVIAEATKTIQRLDEIEHGRRLVIDIQGVNVILEKVTEVVYRHVPDSYTRNLIARDLTAVPVGGTSRPALPSPEQPGIIEGVAVEG